MAKLQREYLPLLRLEQLARAMYAVSHIVANRGDTAAFLHDELPSGVNLWPPFAEARDLSSSTQFGHFRSILYPPYHNITRASANEFPQWPSVPQHWQREQLRCGTNLTGPKILDCVVADVRPPPAKCEAIVELTLPSGRVKELASVAAPFGLKETYSEESAVAVVRTNCTADVENKIVLLLPQPGGPRLLQRVLQCQDAGAVGILHASERLAQPSLRLQENDEAAHVSIPVRIVHIRAGEQIAAAGNSTANGTATVFMGCGLRRPPPAANSTSDSGGKNCAELYDLRESSELELVNVAGLWLVEGYFRRDLVSVGGIDFSRAGERSSRVTATAEQVSSTLFQGPTDGHAFSLFGYNVRAAVPALAAWRTAFVYAADVLSSLSASSGRTLRTIMTAFSMFSRGGSDAGSGAGGGSAPAGGGNNGDDGDPPGKKPPAQWPTHPNKVHHVRAHGVPQEVLDKVTSDPSCIKKELTTAGGRTIRFYEKTVGGKPVEVRTNQLLDGPEEYGTAFFK